MHRLKRQEVNHTAVQTIKLLLIFLRFCWKLFGSLSGTVCAFCTDSGEIKL